MIYYTDLIGVPYGLQGRGPDTYDCYGALSECHRRDGRIIPELVTPAGFEAMESLVNTEKQLWTPLWLKEGQGHAPEAADTPVGSTLILKVQGWACHVAYVVRPGKFLHAWDATGGVTVERISLWRQRILGVYNYDPRDNSD